MALKFSPRQLVFGGTNSYESLPATVTAVRPSTTRTSTVSVAVSVPSLTVSSKVSVSVTPVATSGDVNSGWPAALSFSVTVAPPVCCQEYVIVSAGSGSLDAVPSRTIRLTSATSWSGPAFATGGLFAPMPMSLTVMLTVAELLSVPSFTVSWKVRTSDTTEPSTSGAVKLGVAVSAPVKVTLEPAVCVHAKVSASPSGSDDAVPSRPTPESSSTDCATPAFALGVPLVGGGVVPPLSEPPLPPHAASVAAHRVSINVFRPGMCFML